MTNCESLIKTLRQNHMDLSADRLEEALKNLSESISACNQDVKEKIVECTNAGDFGKIQRLLSIPTLVIQCTKDPLGTAEPAPEAKSIAPRNTFADLGIPPHTTLKFVYDDSVQCVTIDEKNKVDYQGKQYSISGLSSLLTGRRGSNGFACFKYLGTRLTDLRNDICNEKTDTTDIK